MTDADSTDNIVKYTTKELLASMDHRIGIVEEVIRKFDHDLRVVISNLGSDVRSLQEAGRLAEERVKVAADTLATETERRREELAIQVDSTDRSTQAKRDTFTKNERVVALLIGTGLTVLTLVLTTPWS